MEQNAILCYPAPQAPKALTRHDCCDKLFSRRYLYDLLADSGEKVWTGCRKFVALKSNKGRCTADTPM